MKQSSLTEERVALAVRHAESGVLIAGISRRLGVTGVTCYRWQKRFAGMSIEVFHSVPIQEFCLLLEGVERQDETDDP